MLKLVFKAVNQYHVIMANFYHHLLQILVISVTLIAYNNINGRNQTNKAFVEAASYKVNMNRSLLELMIKLNYDYSRPFLEPEKCTRFIHALVHYYKIAIDYNQPNIQTGLYVLRRALGELVLSRLHENPVSRSINACFFKLKLNRRLFYDPSLELAIDSFVDGMKLRPIDNSLQLRLNQISNQLVESYQEYKQALADEVKSFENRFREDHFEAKQSSNNEDVESVDDSAATGAGGSSSTVAVDSESQSAISETGAKDDNKRHGSIVSNKLKKKKQFYEILRQHQECSVDLASYTYALAALHEYSPNNPHIDGAATSEVARQQASESSAAQGSKLYHELSDMPPPSSSSKRTRLSASIDETSTSEQTPFSESFLSTNQAEGDDSSFLESGDPISSWLVEQLNDDDTYDTNQFLVPNTPIIPSDSFVPFSPQISQQFRQPQTPQTPRHYPQTPQLPQTPRHHPPTPQRQQPQTPQNLPPLSQKVSKKQKASTETQAKASASSSRQAKQKGPRKEKNPLLQLPTKDCLKSFETLLTEEPAIDNKLTLQAMLKSVAAEMMLSSSTAFIEGDRAYQAVMTQVEMFLAAMFPEEINAGVVLTGYPQLNSETTPSIVRASEDSQPVPSTGGLSIREPDSLASPRSRPMTRSRSKLKETVVHVHESDDDH